MILVTGSTGIVGTRIVFDLLKSGRTVRALKRPKSDLDFVLRSFRFYDREAADALFAEVDWVEGDVLDFHSLESAMKGVHTVYHCAALVSYSPADAHEMMRCNVLGTRNVVDLALELGIERFCHISSVASLGRPGRGAPATEKNWWKRSSSNTRYGLSKYLAEQEVWRAAAEGLQVVIVNPSVIFGPAKPGQSSGQLMNLLAKGVGYYPAGSAGFVDVRDVSAMSIALSEKGLFEERYILNAANVPYRALLEMAAHVFGHKPPTFAVRPWMLGIAWRVLALGRIMGLAKPVITGESARSASRHSVYSNEKILHALQQEFIAPKASLAYYRAFYG